MGKRKGGSGRNSKRAEKRSRTPSELTSKSSGNESRRHRLPERFRILPR